MLQKSRIVLLLLTQVTAAAAADLYTLLGVGRDADDRSLKKAYRKRALVDHPDKQTAKTDAEKKAAQDRFIATTHAYEVLSDPDKRKLYDVHGADGLKAAESGRGAGFGRGGFAFRDAQSVFEAMFGGSGNSFGGVGGSSSTVYMDPRTGRIFMQQESSPGAGRQRQRQRQQQQQRQYAQYAQHDHAEQARAQQHARAQQQASTEQRARQAEFDAEARAAQEAQYARRRTAHGAKTESSKLGKSRLGSI